MYSALLNRILPPLMSLTRSDYLGIAQKLRRRQYWTSGHLLAYQRERLQAVVKHAATNVPFYRERFAGHRQQFDETRFDDLNVLPITTKSDILANFPDRMTATLQRTTDWQYTGTGGTTNRIIVIHDFEKRDVARAAAALVMTEDSPYQIGHRQVSIPADACSSVCGIEGLREKSVIRHLSQMIWRGTIRDAKDVSNLRGLVMNNWIDRARILDPFGPDGTHISDDRLAEYVAAIRETRPQMLMGLPEYLQMLARYVKRTGDAIGRKIPVIRPMGALMPLIVKREVQDVLAEVVLEHYGCRELGGIAFECAQQNGLHVLSDLFVVEVLSGNRRAREGELGAITITDLTNTAMPLIRYRIGDVGSLRTDPCPCGRSTPRLFVEGRLEDTITTKSGRILTPAAMCTFFYSEPGIDQFQLIEHSSRWELRCVVDENRFNERAMATRFAEFVGDERPLRVRISRSILPEPSGKFRHIKSLSHRPLIGAPSERQTALV